MRSRALLEINKVIILSAVVFLAILPVGAGPKPKKLTRLELQAKKIVWRFLKTYFSAGWSKAKKDVLLSYQKQVLESLSLEKEILKRDYQKGLRIEEVFTIKHHPHFKGKMVVIVSLSRGGGKPSYIFALYKGKIIEYGVEFNVCKIFFLPRRIGGAIFVVKRIFLKTRNLFISKHKLTEI